MISSQKFLWLFAAKMYTFLLKGTFFEVFMIKSIYFVFGILVGVFISMAVLLIDMDDEDDVFAEYPPIERRY